MALRYDTNSLKAVQTEDPSVFIVTVDVTNDTDTAVPNDWDKKFTQVSVRWNKNMNASQFAAAVQAAYNAAQVKTSETALITALNTAFASSGKAFVRSDPAPATTPGTSKENPLFVKVVT